MEPPPVAAGGVGGGGRKPEWPAQWSGGSMATPRDAPQGRPKRKAGSEARAMEAPAQSPLHCARSSGGGSLT